MPDTTPPRPVYPSLIGAAIRDALREHGIVADRPVSNGAWCVHQMRALLPGDPTVYRVLIAPADAPIEIGGVPADVHFGEPDLATTRMPRLVASNEGR